MFATQLATVARRTGYKVVEVDGWQNRTTHDAPSGLVIVEGIVCHHTAGPAGSSAPSLGVVRDGREDLSGPLSNYLLSRDGIIYVVAAGKCNHAGDVNDPRFQNSHSIGIEGENKGDGTEPWPDLQMQAYRSLCHELIIEYKLSPEMVRGHKEVATNPPGRKTDPNFDMVAFRRTMQEEGDPVSDFVAGRVWGDIDRVHPTLIARAQRAGKSGNFSISVQDGWRSMSDAWGYWNAYQRYLHGGPYAPVAAVPGTSLHMGNAPAYNPSLAMDLTIHLPNGTTVSPRSEPVRSHMYAAGLHDPVSSEDWHWQAKEDRYPPMEQPDPIVEVLKQGSTGPAVSALQQHLNYLMKGKPGFPIGVDGSYGPTTSRAVMAYQAQAPGLTADGMAGPLTLNSIAFFYAHRENRYSDQPTVKINDAGHPDAVALIQQLCVVMGQKVVVDGKFGPGTEAAVKVVQGKWGIGADGICGPQWWSRADDLMDTIGTPN